MLRWSGSNQFPFEDGGPTDKATLKGQGNVTVVLERLGGIDGEWGWQKKAQWRGKNGW